MTKHRVYTVFSIFLNMLMGFLGMFFAMFMFVKAERLSALALKISSVKGFFNSPILFQYLSFIVFIVAVLVIMSSVIRSRIYFERRTLFGRAVAAKAVEYSRNIDSWAKEALTVLMILTLAYAMASPTLKPMLGEFLWTGVTTIFFMVLGLAALLSLMILLTRASIAYLAAMYEVRREMSHGPLREVPEIEEI